MSKVLMCVVQKSADPLLVCMSPVCLCGRPVFGWSLCVRAKPAHDFASCEFARRVCYASRSTTAHAIHAVGGADERLMTT
eukprot:161473-Chlamydomonas_euryale.AAC.2